MSGNRKFYYCEEMGDCLWRVSWIEHNSLNSGFIQRQKEPKFKSFADLKKVKWLSEKKAFALKGITLKTKRRK